MGIFRLLNILEQCLESLAYSFGQITPYRLYAIVNNIIFALSPVLTDYLMKIR